MPADGNEKTPGATRDARSVVKHSPEPSRVLAGCLALACRAGAIVPRAACDLLRRQLSWREVVPMSTAFLQSSELELSEALARLRGHAALVRALVDELDRLCVAPL